jgi:peptidoglycan/LPS O-acetylase OafA/YrhL
VTWHFFYYDTSADHHPIGLVRNLYAFLSRFLGLGWSGVDLFFVLSGFLIGGILLDVRGSPTYFKTFYLRRFYRIVPIYYVWILGYPLVMSIAGEFLKAHVPGGSAPDSKYQLLLQLMFLQNFGIFDYAPISRAWLAPTWSLAVEEQFYLFAPLVIRYLSKRALYAFLIITIVTAPIARVIFYYHLPRWHGDFPLPYTLTPCRADALAIGVLGALLWREDKFSSWLLAHRKSLYGLITVFAAVLIGLGKWSPRFDTFAQIFVGYTCNAIFYVLILLIALVRPAGPIAWVTRTSWLRELGRVSYCLYLIHQAVNLICEAIYRAVLHHLTAVEAILLNVVAAVVSYLIARVSWHYFEYPILSVGRSFKYSDSVSRPNGQPAD